MLTHFEHSVAATNRPSREQLDSVVIRFAGDSGDGMQLAGTQFTETTASMGNDLSTFPDFPAEIRAPAGTLYGVSGFQIQFASQEVETPGDRPDVLVAMNPAALKVNLPDLPEGGLLMVNTGAFTDSNLSKAGYAANPLEDGSLEGYRLLEVDVTKLSVAAVKAYGLGTKEAQRCKNMWTLGLMFWLFGRDKEPTVGWLRRKFANRENVAEANIAALNAGHAYAETAELPSGIGVYQIPRAPRQPGLYRNINGNQATAWGLAAGADLAGLPLVYGSYPITPASTMLHYLAGMKNLGVTTFQAEDEIAAVCAAIGASYGGALGASATSGPGLVLKTEALGLAVAAEIPLVIVDVQRAGPSTGMPTKTEQSDLLQALFGRNGDSPLVVLAPATPGDCFSVAVEAVRLATKYMTPVLVLTDAFLANGAEPWRIPDLEAFEPFPVQFRTDPVGFHPFARDPQTLARPWAVPGTPGLEHRLGGLERSFETGHISYDPENHHKMTEIRAEKIRRIANELPAASLETGRGDEPLLVVGWGSSYGPIREAVKQVRARGGNVAHLHLRHLSPLPKGLGEIIRRFSRVLVPELNAGMLTRVLRSEYLVDVQGFHRVTGKPFRVDELQTQIESHLQVQP